MLAQFLAHTPANFVSFTDSFIVSFKKLYSFPGPKAYRDFRETYPRDNIRRKGFNISGQRANNRGMDLYPGEGLISGGRANNRGKDLYPGKELITGGRAYI